LLRKEIYQKFHQKSLYDLAAFADTLIILNLLCKEIRQKS